MAADKIPDKALVELYSKMTRGNWKIASGEDFKFHIYVEDTSPIKYVMKEVPEDVSHYDLRGMSLVKQLIEEVLEYRIKERKNAVS